MFGMGAREAEVMEIKMVLYLPRDAASVPVSRQVLDGCLETLGVTADTRTDIALALTESCANVIQHADPADEYEVQAKASKGRCVIEVVNTAHRDAADARAARRSRTTASRSRRRPDRCPPPPSTAGACRSSTPWWTTSG